MAQKTYESARQHLLKCAPKLIKASGAPNKSFREIVIRFEGANLDYADLARALEIYCWPTNTKKSGSIVDPYADGGPEQGKIEGLWRFSSVNPTHGRVEGLFLTLRAGYASTLMWDEARVPSRDTLPKTNNVPIEAGVANADEDYIDLLFPNVDPQKSQAMADALRALGTVEAPTIWTHKYTGTYYVVHARAREEDDGSHSVIGLLAKSRCFAKTYENFESHDAADVYYLHHVPKAIVQSVIDNAAYKKDGASSTLNYSTDRGTYDVIIRTGVDDPITVLNKKMEDGCLTEVFADFYFGITKTKLKTITLTNAPQGWIYQIAGISPAANGRFGVRVDRIHAIHREPLSYTSQITKTDETVTEEKKNQIVVATLGVSVQGVIKRIRKMLNRFCVWDTQTDETTSTPWEIAPFTVEGADGDEIHTVKGNQRTIAFDTPGDGFSNRLSGFSRNEDGTFNWHIVKEPNPYDTETTQYWYWTEISFKTMIISSGHQAGWYQDYAKTNYWKYESKRFKTEDAAYLWLRESSGYESNSGVETRGNAKFRAHRTFLAVNNPWIWTGMPYRE